MNAELVLRHRFHPFPVFSSACRSANIDLVLLIDGSKSVRPHNFELVKKFVNQVEIFLFFFTFYLVHPKIIHFI